MTSSAPAPLWPSALYYAGYYFSLGVGMPYMPLVLADRGVPPAELGLLQALGPAATIALPVAVGRWADRHQRPLFALRLSLAVSLLGWATLALDGSRAATWLGYVLLALGGSPGVSLVDAQTIRLAAERGVDFGRIRLVGSVCFVAGAAVSGRLLATGLIERSHVLALTAGGVLVAAAAAWSMRTARVVDRPAAPPFRAVLGRPGLVTLLVVCALQWVGMAPYNGGFARHAASLGLDDGIAGVAMAVGATAEIVSFAASRWLIGTPTHRGLMAPETALQLALGASVLRWGAVAMVDTAAPLIALQLLHALSFGLFYLAAMALLHRLGGEGERSTLQGLFVSVVFGVGGSVGLVTSGLVAEAWGARATFAAAMIPVAIAFVLARRPAGAREPQVQGSR